MLTRTGRRRGRQSNCRSASAKPSITECADFKPARVADKWCIAMTRSVRLELCLMPIFSVFNV